MNIYKKPFFFCIYNPLTDSRKVFITTFIRWNISSLFPFSVLRATDAKLPYKLRASSRDRNSTNVVQKGSLNRSHISDKQLTYGQLNPFLQRFIGFASPKGNHLCGCLSKQLFPTPLRDTITPFLISHGRAEYECFRSLHLNSVSNSSTSYCFEFVFICGPWWYIVYHGAPSCSFHIIPGRRFLYWQDLSPDRRKRFICGERNRSHRGG